MSQRGDGEVSAICGMIRNIPLLELLVEYMDSSKRIQELLKQLEEERRNVRREKLAVAHLQRKVARCKSEGTMRGQLIHELEEERRLRLGSEKRLREVTEEFEQGRAQMASLQQHFSRMEETVRSILQGQGVAVDTMDIMKAYKDKLSEEAPKRANGPQEHGCPPAAHPQPDPGPPVDGSQSGEDKGEAGLLLQRLKALETENSALALENKRQREQYERCLDEVANQVVQALLTQKDLREECLKLRTRVFDLEQQNQSLSVLFQQRVKPASELLLQKLHSRILDLSAADLLLEPERAGRGFPLPARHTDSPSHDVQCNGRAGLPVVRCLSQLSLTVPGPAYRRSSCSSSEISLSSACSEYSSGSYTWNDGRSYGKMSSLTWEKRLSLGSSAPSNICGPLEEQLPARCKESHILEGLRRLQRRSHRSSSSLSKVSRSGSKDCMDSNEGIYSLGLKKGICKPYLGRAFCPGTRRFSCDSDDADDESAQHSGRRGNVSGRDNGLLHCGKLSHSVSDSSCSWEGLQDGPAPSRGVGGGLAATSPVFTEHPPSYNANEQPEKLYSILPGGGGRPSAFSRPSWLRPEPPDTEVPLSDTDDPEELGLELALELGDAPTPASRPAGRAAKEPPTPRPSREIAKLLVRRCLRREQGRTQSADGRPFSITKEPAATKCALSDESISAIFDADGKPIELSAGGGTDRQNVAYAEIALQERPVRQKAAKAKNCTMLESPERPSECQSKADTHGISREGSTQGPSVHVSPQMKLIRPPSHRANVGSSIPPVNDNVSSPGTRIPGGGKPSASPLRVTKGSPTDPNSSGNSGPPGLEKSPTSPPVKTSRFIKTPAGSSGAAQSPKALASKIPGRGGDWSSGSPSRKPPGHTDSGEQPTRDEHCETSKNYLRSPSPPLPPGRTTSLLVRPNYEGSPPAHKPPAQSSTPTTVRGPPPSYHPPPVPNMQATLPLKSQDSLDLDAGYGTALAPQKQVDRTAQHLQKSPAATPCKGTSTRAADKHYLPSSASSGCAPESPDSSPKGSKNVPPPYTALRGSSFQSTFANKTGSAQETVALATHKTSGSLPVSLQEPPQYARPHGVKIVSPYAVVSPPCGDANPPSPVDKAKTRIPTGFKSFLKSPTAHKHAPSIPDKHEKDHINSVSKETSAAASCESWQAALAVGSLPAASGSTAEGKGGEQGRPPREIVEVLPEKGEGMGEACGKGRTSNHNFSRSVSVSNKPHLKPALGMNGTKVRSQSFSANVGAPDGPGKVRTQIITNSGERGNSLSRQNSLEPAGVGPIESPSHRPGNRFSHYGGMTGSNYAGALPEQISKPSAFRADGSATASEAGGQQKEVRSLPSADRTGLKNARWPAKTAPHPQFQPASSATQETKVASPRKLDDVTGSNKTQVVGHTAAVCTIEEKVMLGIEENLQKCQVLEKATTSEVKQKTGPSLANWFWLRKSKLPAFSGKKTDSPKGKEEKKELRIGSVLGSKQTKADKKKDKKKSDGQEEQGLLDDNNKLSTIMDRCNVQTGHIANQIHCSNAYVANDQLVKEILVRGNTKGDTRKTPLPGSSAPRRHEPMGEDADTCADATTLLVTQKMKLKAESEVGRAPDSTCQDHMIGSSCQMRTLDSGIGTFPLPDSASRASGGGSSGRHLPKSESSPGRVAETGSSPEPLPPPPTSKVPSFPRARPRAPDGLGHSVSDPAVTCSGRNHDAQSRLPKPVVSDAMRAKRRSLFETRSPVPADIEERQANGHCGSPSDMAGRGCRHSSSDSEADWGSGGGTPLGSPQKTLLNRPKSSRPVSCVRQALEPDGGTLKRSCVEQPLSILGCYHLMEEQSRGFSQYTLLHAEEPLLDGTVADNLSKEMSSEKKTATTIGVMQPGLSLETLNQLNHSGPGGEGTRLGADLNAVAGGVAADEPPLSYPGVPGGTELSLSDSLYDSFSSCTSHGSNDV